MVQGDDGRKRLQAVFFRTDGWREPVREWLVEALDRAERAKVGVDIRRVELGRPLGMPTCRPIGGGLWEVRTNLDRRIARVIFCVGQGRMVLLHGFIKKNRQTPDEDIALARRRKKELESDHG